MAENKTLILGEWKLDDKRYVDILTKLIGEVKYLQNSPPTYVPQETKAARHCIDALKPYTLNGGPLTVELVEYAEGRGNLIIEYKSPNPNAAGQLVSFVGSHLDVVPADPTTWDRDPFNLVIEGDKYYARGTTDCLGHVALLTELFTQLGEKQPPLEFNVVGVFIASEENTTIMDVGIDKLMKEGRLDRLKSGPVFWVDSADSQPCIGCMTAMRWTLRAEGRLFHSGLPWKGINALELASEACSILQAFFYEKYPPHKDEIEYNFLGSSTMKPTRLEHMQGSFNQLPSWAEFSGDVRLAPFYNHHDCRDALIKKVEWLNENINEIPTRGPHSKYEITVDGTSFRGKLSLDIAKEDMAGIFCSKESIGFKCLNESTKKVLGESNPYSVGGSLPLVGTMKEQGFDIQLVGFGLSSVYHGDNEYLKLTDMQHGFKIIAQTLSLINNAKK